MDYSDGSSNGAVELQQQHYFLICLILQYYGAAIFFQNIYNFFESFFNIFN